MSRISADAKTVIPPELLAALNLKEGDEIAFEVVGNRLVVMRAEDAFDPFVNNFSTFTEWASEADRAYDNL